MKNFIKGFDLPKQIANNSFVFLFSNGNLVVKKVNEKILIPSYSDVKKYNLFENGFGYLGKLKTTDCYYAYSENELKNNDYESLNLRFVYGYVSDDIFEVALYASHIANWDKNSQFCGKCGNTTIHLKEEKAKKCTHCGLLNYPKISPAVIVAITKDDKLLLATNKRFKSGIYSILAGFVEPGESLEECIHREIKEEVNIEIKNIKYFGSQPWPFPDSLMIGYFAEYKSGEIQPDDDELEDAGWYRKDKLPKLPLKFSIAGKMIDKFIKEH